MVESLRVQTILPGDPRRVNVAWLDSQEHSLFTGSSARVAPVLGGRPAAWDGYIEGSNLILELYSRIVQTWRTTEFPPGSADSRL
jgi:hypothetical protein